MINRYSPVPMYLQLKDLIVDKIKNGEYKIGHKIPSEKEFCNFYNISRATVRQAIIELTFSGYLVKEKGKGTYVQSINSQVKMDDYTGFYNSLLDCEFPGQKEIISVEVVNIEDNDSLIYSFNTQKNLDFTKVKFIEKQNNEIFQYSISYVPTEYFPNLKEDILNNSPSYEVMKGKYPYLPNKSMSNIEVKLADIDDAKILNIKTGNVLIRVENIIYSKSGLAVEFIITLFKGDRCKLSFKNLK